MGTKLFTSVTYIHMHFRLDFNMEANIMNPDQTYLGQYCFRNKFDFRNVHGIMNTSGLLQSK